TDLQLVRTLAGGRAAVGHRRRAGVAAAEPLDAGRAMRRTVSLVAGRRVGHTRSAREFALDAARMGGHLRTELRVSECAPFAGGRTAAQGLDVAGRTRIAACGGHSGVVWAVGALGRGMGIGSLLGRMGGGAARPAAGRAGTGCAAGRLERSGHCLDPDTGRDRQWTARVDCDVLLVRDRCGGPGGVGHPRCARRAGESGRRRPGDYRAGLLFLERHGQAGPFRKPDRDRSSVSWRRLGVGKDAPAAAGAYVKGGFMKPVYRGIAVAVLQCLIVLSVAGKYALDRERLPRVWAMAAPFDPYLPVRGRYVSLRLQ